MNTEWQFRCVSLIAGSAALACHKMIKKSIQEKLKKYYVSSGDNLPGFQIDIEPDRQFIVIIV